MSIPGDHGSWNPQGNEDDARRGGQEPWAQPPTGQDPYGQQPPAGQDPYGQPSAGSASDPYGQQPAAGQEPWAQPTAGQDPYGQQPAAGQEPWGQPPAGQDPYGQPSAGSASDPYGQGQPSWSAAPGSGPSAAGTHGQGAPGTVPQGPGPSRMVVGLLGIFLGAYGVHRFLLGYTTIGIIQIAVTIVTCGIGGLWGVIEGIMILARAEAFERDAHGRPLTD